MVWSVCLDVTAQQVLRWWGCINFIFYSIVLRFLFCFFFTIFSVQHHFCHVKHASVLVFNTFYRVPQFNHWYLFGTRTWCSLLVYTLIKPWNRDSTIIAQWKLTFWKNVTVNVINSWMLQRKTEIKSKFTMRKKKTLQCYLQKRKRKINVFFLWDTFLSHGKYLVPAKNVMGTGLLFTWIHSYLQS